MRVIQKHSDRRFIKLSSQKLQNTTPIGLDRFQSSKFTAFDLFKPRSAVKTKNLIRFLLGHGSRAQRAALPRKNLKLMVLNPKGKQALLLRMNA